MDFIVQNWVLILIAVASGAMLLWPSVTSGGGANSLTPTQAVQLINREKAIVIDVCSPEEFAAGHVTNAKNVPIGELENRLTQVVKNKTLPVLMVCASGIRSKRAVAVAKKLGYEKAYSLAGGMGAWRAANLPVQKG
ncbi:rhodanese-like domain-containing protein [Tepidicella baoligensis]|uniref:rhodanese-like domain-containing protein n=1 Tax=Tepidicella baoligensis TaxID=2707016 RepID=UPI0015DA27AD